MGLFKRKKVCKQSDLDRVLDLIDKEKPKWIMPFGEQQACWECSISNKLLFVRVAKTDGNGRFIKGVYFPKRNIIVYDQYNNIVGVFDITENERSIKLYESLLNAYNKVHHKDETERLTQILDDIMKA